MSRVEFWSRDESGSTAIVFALALVPLMALTGAAVDYNRAIAARQQLQGLADTAALSAAALFGTGADPGAAARAFFPAGTQASDPQFTAAAGEGVVTVDASRSLKTSFMGVIGINEMQVSVRSKAAQGDPGPTICALALNKSADAAISFAGNTAFSAKNCVVYSNSSSTSAISLQGSATAQASGFCAVGGVSGSLSPSLKNCPIRADPFRNWTVPVSQGCDYTGNAQTSVGSNKTKQFSPGIYCSTMDLKGTAELAPGVYVLKAGLDIGAQATVRGTGVTFYLTGPNAGFSINGGGDIALSAPVNGAHAGMLIYQDRAANPGAVNKLNGSSNTVLKGILYTPTQVLEVTGNGTFGQSSIFMPMIADRIAFSGSSVVQVESNSDTITAVPMPTLSGGPRLTH